MSNFTPTPLSATALVEVRDIRKTYRMGTSQLEVLKGVDLTLQSGEFVAIMGASGSGKSTLLHIAGALDTPSSGEVLFQNRLFSALPSSERNSIRNRHFGFVFQFYHLLPELNVLENVMLPAMIAAPWWCAFVPGLRGPVIDTTPDSSPIPETRSARAAAIDLLTRFGLGDRLKHRPAQLSGGERQRAAIARALINKPAVLLADEPTGNLDAKTGRTIMDVLLDLHRNHGQTILLVTHDPHIAALADRTIHLDDGRIVN